jgi:hypothetical protein
MKELERSMGLRMRERSKNEGVGAKHGITYARTNAPSETVQRVPGCL